MGYVDKYGRHQMEMSSSPVKQSAHFFTSVEAEIGQPLHVKDVREWLRKVDALGVPDSAEVEGSLHLCIEYQNTNVNRINCGGCDETDIITDTHHCPDL